jgi:hypothetical protein
MWKGTLFVAIAPSTRKPETVAETFRVKCGGFRRLP